MSDKACPFCAEPLQAGTTTCPSCKEALPKGGGPLPPANAAKKMSTGVLVAVILGGLCVLTVPVGAIVAAIAIPNLIEARKHGNEASAIGQLKMLNSAQTLFREGDKDDDGTLDYGSLGDLGQVQLVDGVLATGRKQGYVFTCQQSPLTPELLWFATATPAAPQTTGDRYFATNHSGVIYYSDLGPFSPDASCEIPGNGSPPDARPVGR
jgi:hypothetical protein